VWRLGTRAGDKRQGERQNVGCTSRAEHWGQYTQHAG
jgi:hypothetical protein